LQNILGNLRMLELQASEDFGQTLGMFN